MTARSTGAICMLPTGNAQGVHFFFSLPTGCILNWLEWTDLPIPAEVIDCIHRKSRCKSHGIFFTDGKKFHR